MMKATGNNNTLGNEQGGVLDAQHVVPPQTGSWRSASPHIGPACVGCGICAARCPEHSIYLRGPMPKRSAVIDRDFCKGCGICAAVCPKHAISMK